MSKLFLFYKLTMTSGGNMFDSHLLSIRNIGEQQNI